MQADAATYAMQADGPTYAMRADHTAANRADRTDPMRADHTARTPADPRHRTGRPPHPLAQAQHPPPGTLGRPFRTPTARRTPARRTSCSTAAQHHPNHRGSWKHL